MQQGCAKQSMHDVICPTQAQVKLWHDDNDYCNDAELVEKAMKNAGH